jgi:hypothetical protein
MAITFLRFVFRGLLYTTALTSGAGDANLIHLTSPLSSYCDSAMASLVLSMAQKELPKGCSWSAKVPVVEITDLVIYKSKQIFCRNHICMGIISKSKKANNYEW